MKKENNDSSSIVYSHQFQHLLRLRNGIRYFLTFLIILLHGFFVGGIAFYNQWFSQPLTSSSSVPIGVAAAVAVIVLMLLLEVIYIWISKKVFDPLQEQLLQQVNMNE